MVMTKQDYTKIAAVLADSKPSEGASAIAILTWWDIVNAFVGMLKQDNSNFDEHKFRTAANGAESVLYSTKDPNASWNNPK